MDPECMKRSRTAALVLMSAAPLLLTACTEETTREGLYTSIDDCAEQIGDLSACQDAFEKARKEAELTAPRYASFDECVAEHGTNACTARRDSSGHGYFMPLMMGYLVAQMFRGDKAAGVRGSPAFRDLNGNWKRPAPGAGGVYRDGVPRPMVPISAQPNRAPTVTRGGFGSSGNHRSTGS
jgi:uncharacterized protein YgiB involved in biofilm formation